VFDGQSTEVGQKLTGKVTVLRQDLDHGRAHVAVRISATDQRRTPVIAVTDQEHPEVHAAAGRIG
jgi:hypothetical protein